MIRRHLTGPDDSTETEAIIQELDDDPDKLYVWSFPNWSGKHLEQFAEAFHKGAEYRSDHVFISDETIVSEADDELLIEAFSDVVDKEMIADLVEDRLDGCNLTLEEDNES